MVYYPIGQEKYGGKIGCLIGDEKWLILLLRLGRRT